MADKKLEFCPYDETIPFTCDTTYRMGEFYRQMQLAFGKKQKDYSCISEKIVCECDPEICPKYVLHMMCNLTKYKQNERIK